MNPTSWLAAAVLFAAALTSCSATGPAGITSAANSSPTGQSDAAAAAAAVATGTPAGEAPPAASVVADLPAGTVTVLGGPFTDRLRLGELLLAQDAVTGTLDVVSDVSEILNLEIRVDFYDAVGALLGSNRQVYLTADTEKFHSTAGVVGLPISVTAPASGAHSAVLSIPVLVNE